jgi:nicotinamidase-related amidase
MPELSRVDPRSSALLVMDYQVDTLARFMTAAQSADAIACVPGLIAMARDAGMMVLHVVVAFRPDHPEVSAVAGTVGAAIHPAAAAREGEPIVVKHRISPFVGTDLETLLRANGIDTLVLARVHTSGVVLSTVRHAGDLDYRLVVVRDCCADPDAQVHAIIELRRCRRAFARWKNFRSRAGFRVQPYHGSSTIREAFGRPRAKGSKRRWTGWAIGRICSR